MATHKTPNLGLLKQDHKDPRWDIPLNDTLDILDRLHAICPGITKQLASQAVLDVAVYDATGQAWISDSTKAWHSETLNTATRGATADFPDKVALVLTDTTLTIYDATHSDAPMWMVFLCSNDNMIRSHANCCLMVNGVLVVGLSDSGVHFIDFRNSAGLRHISGNPPKKHKGTIAERNNGAGDAAEPSGWMLSDSKITSLASNGTLVAISTHKGVTVVDGSDSYFSAVTTLASNVAFNDSGELLYDRGDGTDKIYITSSYKRAGFTHDKQYVTNTSPALINDKPTGIVEAGTLLSVSSRSGLTLIDEDSTPAKGMTAHITPTFNTGWMQGDLQRCWLANGLLEDRSIKNQPLTANGTLNLKPVESGAELQCVSGFSNVNYLLQPMHSDFDIGAGDFTISLWMKPSSFGSSEYLFCKMKRGSNSPATGRIRLFISDIGKVTSFVGSKSGTTTSFVGLSKWTNVVVVRKSGDVTVFLDSAPSLTYSSPAALTNIDDSVFIGVNQSNGGHFSGSISLMKFSKTAMSPAQITKTYTDEKELFAPSVKCLVKAPINAISEGVKENILATDGGLVSVKGLTCKEIHIPKATSQKSSSVVAGDATLVGTASGGYFFKEGINLCKEVRKLIAATPKIVYSTLTAFETGAFPTSVAQNSYTDLKNFYAELDNGVGVDKVLGTFTINVSGTYKISAHLGLLFKAVASATACTIYSYSNGAVIARGRAGVYSGNEGCEIYMTEILNFNAGDVITFKFYSGSNLTKISRLDVNFQVQKL